jgi:hypothetical protein
MDLKKYNLKELYEIAEWAANIGFYFLTKEIIKEIKNRKDKN